MGERELVMLMVCSSLGLTVTFTVLDTMVSLTWKKLL